MHCNHADLSAGLSYGSSIVADLRDPVGADASGVESHAERLADSAGRQAACSLPVAIELDILPAEYEKGRWNSDDHKQPMTVAEAESTLDDIYPFKIQKRFCGRNF